MGRVREKVALITGAAMGLGKATAELLAHEGAHVAVTDVDDPAGEQVAKSIRKAQTDARYWHLDVSDEDNVRSVVDAVVSAFGPIDILVNNAGISGVNKPTHEVDAADWQRVMDVNVNGVFYCTKHVVPHMQANGGGSIVNLSSIYGLVGGPDVPPYHASKGAVRLMTKTDALLYASDQIRVNSIHPGYIWTPMVENHLQTMGDVEERRKEVAALHPLGHMGDPEDVAYGVLYLASPESRFVTGTELVIDGGYTAQ